MEVAGGRWGSAHLPACPPVAARAEAARLKALVAQNRDPLDLKRAAKAIIISDRKAAKNEADAEAATFRVLAKQYITAQESGWRNAKHRQQWENTLATYAFPVIGDLPVRDIAVAHVLQILQPIWSTKPETASRVRLACGRDRAIGGNRRQNHLMPEILRLGFQLLRRPAKLLA